MHVPYGLWIAMAGANVAIAALIVGWLLTVRGRPATTARAYAVAVAAWLAAAFALGGLNVFKAATGRPAFPIALGVVVPIGVGVALFRRHAATRELVASATTPQLIGVQLYRAIGGLFLVAWAIGIMPWQFALPAGIGDVLVGLAAPFVARNGSRRAAVTWNVIGILDLVVAVGTGFLTSPSPFQHLALGNPNLFVSRLPFVVVPTFAVPLSILLHLAALQRLRATAPETEPALQAGGRRVTPAGVVVGGR